MDASTFLALTLACAPQVHADTAHALVSVESAFNPWAIGVVGGALQRQPRHRTEAMATAQALQAAGRNFSVGLGQINVGNFSRLGLTLTTAFERSVFGRRQHTEGSNTWEQGCAVKHLLTFILISINYQSQNNQG
jgi:hypothetical protein